MGVARRYVLSHLAALPLVSMTARMARAQTFREIGWDALIPEGVPYSRIVAQGEVDEAADRWLPIFDVNAYRFAEHLDGARIRMPGFVLPLETDARGVGAFILTPYAGACVHVPPPPPNQLVFVTARTPWRLGSLFEAVWVEGTIRVNPMTTDLAEIGYEIDAERIEIYE